MQHLAVAGPTPAAYGYWRERVVQASGAVAQFDDFGSFVADPPPDGVGTDVKTLLRLCSDDLDALDELKRVGIKNWGGDRRSTVFKDDITTLENKGVTRPRAGKGNDRLYALRRLSKDRPDLHAEVLAGHLTPHGAMVEAGFRPRAYRMPMTVVGLVDAIRRHFTQEEVRELVKLLTEPV